MKSIVYTRPDGGRSICHPVVSLDDPVGFGEAEAIARATEFDIPADATNIHIVERQNIPLDRTAREVFFASLG